MITVPRGNGKVAGKACGSETALPAWAQAGTWPSFGLYRSDVGWVEPAGWETVDDPQPANTMVIVAASSNENRSTLNCATVHSL